MATNAYLNMLDVAKINADSKVIDLIEENLLVAPEARIIPAMTIKGTSYTTLIRKTYPQPKFRAPGGVANTLKSTYDNRLVNCFYLDGPLEMDVAQARAVERGEQYALDLEASGVMKGSLLTLGSQLYYGIANDPLGFPGAQSIVDASLVFNAAGTTAATASSVYGFKLGDQWVNYVFGLGSVLTMGEWRKQFVTRTVGGVTGEQEAWKNVLAGYVGVQFVNKYAVGNIKNLTADAGCTLTDAMIASWLSQYPIGYEPDVLFMSRRSVLQLQTSRSSTSITNARTGKALNTGYDVWAPEPTSSCGIPIVKTDSIINTEALR